MHLARPKRPDQRDAFFQTMIAVVTLEGSQGMLLLERRSIEAIGRHILDTEVDVDAYEPEVPAHLPSLIADPELRLTLVRLCMTLPFVGGEVSAPQVVMVHKIAKLLATEREELALLDRAVRKSWFWFQWRLIKHGVDEYWNTNGKATWWDWMTIVIDGIRPGTIARPKTAARFQALRALPLDTMGGALAQYYLDKKFPMPGEKGGTNEKFALHDFYHIIAGYAPEPVVPNQPGTVRGEMLVSVYTGGNKVYEPMDWVIVPLLQWHCGAPAVTYKRQYAKKDLLDPDAYYHAWRRGTEQSVNMMDKWDWWDHTEKRVEDVRRDYHVMPLQPELDGVREPPDELQDRRRLPRQAPQRLAA